MSQYKDCSGASGDDSGFYARARLDEIAQLRAELAQVTAERDEALASEARLLAVESKQFRLVLDAQQQLEAERAAHAETRKALEEWTHNVFGPKTPAEVQVFIEEGCRVERELAEHNAKLLESTRAELAKAEARVKEADRIASQLKGSFDEWPDDTSENDLLALDLARILEALRGRP